MKLLWGIFLGLLLLLQLIGWQVYGRAEPIAAVSVIAYPSATLIGVFFSYIYHHDKKWLFALPLLLFLVQIQVIQAPRHAPRDALITHAMSRFLGSEVNLIESYLGGGILLLVMCAIAVFSAYLSAEVGGRITGKRHITGSSLLSGTWQMFLQWEKKNVPTTQPEERNEK